MRCEVTVTSPLLSHWFKKRKSHTIAPLFQAQNDKKQVSFLFGPNVRSLDYDSFI